MDCADLPRTEDDRRNTDALFSYNYPGNLAELAEILHRAVIMMPPGHGGIPEQVLWSVQSTRNAFRLVGGMNGMFAKLSMVELRSTQQVCGSQCSTFGCYKGSGGTTVTFTDALPNEGQATTGCPLYSHPAQLQNNRDCMLCMTCLKGCPNRSAQLNLRFPASDLLDQHQGFWAEAALLLLLLGGVLMHHTQTILAWLGLGSIPVDAEH